MYAFPLQRPDEPPEENVKFPDILEEAALLEWAGISFGRSEAYRLYLSIKKFSQSLSADVERLRFFGRISTRNAPYFVIEGINPEDEEGADELLQEGRNGANKYSYWVSQCLESGVWTKLPNVTMAQVVTARQFKRYLTGNLNAPVPTYPPFPGTEKNLLRALIAIIAGATSISPAGYFELNEEEDPPTIKLAEQEVLNEAFPKPAADLKEADAWNHHEIELNILGRVLPMPEQLDENGDPIEPEETVETTPPLKAVETEQWSFRLCPGGSGESANSVVSARSLLYPGAYAIAAGRRFLTVYVGDGIPYSVGSYTPPMPAPVQSEWTPTEEEETLIEQADILIDPTPPKEEGEEEDA